MANNNEQSSGIKINRGRIGSISLYDVTQDELEILENGSPNSTYLNFGIGLISIGISFFVSIFSTTINSIKTYNVFWVVACVATLAGAVLLVVWYRSNKGMKNIIKRIKGRLKSISSDDDLDNSSSQHTDSQEDGAK